ncbi:MAG: response regulator transcription factor [Bacteroidia bacterium]|nr:response regulator transcription factor [Bacteroidia bacterium]
MTKTSKIRVALAEDNVFLARSIEDRLSFFDDIEFRFHSLNGVALLQQLQAGEMVDVLLMDLQMPEMDGIEATSEVKRLYPHIKVLVLTVLDTDDLIIKAIQAGVNGYLLKEIDADELHTMIKTVNEGGAVMTPSVAAKALRIMQKVSPVTGPTNNEAYKLTPRETDILEQLASGLGYKVIATNLVISPFTVRKHIENIYKKLHVHNKVEAIRKAQDSNLI